MTTWVALFRGINVGGNNLLPMSELRTMLAHIGCSQIRTYIQSGNVVFTISGSKTSQLSRKIGESVRKQFGFEPKVLLLSVTELEIAIATNPFPEGETEPKTLHVFFLSEKPKNADLDTINEIKTGNEKYKLTGSVFYLYAPDGIARSKLAAKAERLLGVDATARNWRTVLKLQELARDKG